MVCYLHRPKQLPASGSKALVYFRGGGCVQGQAEHRIEVATRIAVMAGCIVINCNYRKCPETKFPLPVYDAYAIFKHVVGKAV